MSLQDLSTTIRPHARQCYIAGPMANQPDHGFPAFHAAAVTLRSEGWVVTSPAEGVPDHLVQMGIDMGWAFRETQEYADLMRKDLCLVLEASELFVLPGWLRSSGARREVVLAQTVGTPVTDYETRTPVTKKFELVVSGVYRVPRAA